MKIGCEIKMIEIKSDVILENIFYWKHNSKKKKNQGDGLIQEHNGYK